jgi:hypothetical protein
MDLFVLMCCILLSIVPLPLFLQIHSIKFPQSSSSSNHQQEMDDGRRSSSEMRRALDDIGSLDDDEDFSLMATLTTNRPPTCSNCHQVGHAKTHKACPMRAQLMQQAKRQQLAQKMANQRAATAAAIIPREKKEGIQGKDEDNRRQLLPTEPQGKEMAMAKIMMDLKGDGSSSSNQMAGIAQPPINRDWRHVQQSLPVAVTQMLLGLENVLDQFWEAITTVNLDQKRRRPMDQEGGDAKKPRMDME